MGILVKHLHIIAMQQPFYPISGDVLILGQQMIYATENEVRKIFASHGIDLNILPQEFDSKSKIQGSDKQHINVKALFKMLGANNVFVLDISDFEGADIILDLNVLAPIELHNRFDVIFDSGTLEHVFDVPTALTSIVRMLKPRGIVALGCVSSNAIDHGFYSFSPTLFYDYFSAQDFTNLSTFVCEASVHNLYLRSKVYKYIGVGGQFPIISKRTLETHFWASKNKNTELIIKPMQTLYKNTWETSAEAKKPAYSRLKKIIKALMNLIPASVRPEFIDALIVSNLTRFDKRDNFKYIGKY